MRYLVCFLIGLAVAPLLRAQAAEGRVVDSLSGTPIAGALVLLVDSAGAERARALTYESGGFLLRAPAPGRYRVRVLRIGFQRWESPPVSLEPGRTVALRTAVPSVPLVLPDVEVVSESPCRARPGSEADLAAVWEEVQKALAATEETMKRGGFRFRTRTWRRRLTPEFTTFTEEVSGGVEYRLWPVESAPPEQLARHGFVQATAEPLAPIYYAPDTDLLVHDLFLADHCFRLVSAGGEGGQVGLAFEPVPGRKVSDVAGTLWIDRRTHALLALEYRFTRLPDWVPRDRAGGRYEFAPLPNGGWVMRRWWLRAPVASVSPERKRPKLYGYDEVGGEVLEVLSAQGRTLKSWEAPDRQRSTGPAAGPQPDQPPPILDPTTSASGPDASADPATATAAMSVARDGAPVDSADAAVVVWSRPLGAADAALVHATVGQLVGVRNTTDASIRVLSVRVMQCLNVPASVCATHTLAREVAPGASEAILLVRPLNPYAQFTFGVRLRWEADRKSVV